MTSHFSEFTAFYSIFNNSINASISKCIIYETIEKKASFEPGLIDITTNFQPHHIDLRKLLKKYHADENDISVRLNDPYLATKILNLTEPTSTVRFYTRLCSKSFEYAKFNTKKRQAFSFGALLFEINKTKKMVSLGKDLSDAEFSMDANILKLRYMNGDKCFSNVSTRYSFEVNLRCVTGREQQMTFIKTTKQGCHFEFEWLTAEVCRKKSVLDENESCQIVDPNVDDDVELVNSFSGFRYEMDRLKEKMFTVNDTRVRYKLDQIGEY